MSTEGMEGMFDTLADKIGAAAALRLLALFGGASLYVPDKPSEEHPIARAIGFTAMDILCATWGNQVLDLPQQDEFDRLRRVRSVARLLCAGHRPQEIADLFGVSARQVANYRAQAERLGLLPTIFRTRGEALLNPEFDHLQRIRSVSWLAICHSPHVVARLLGLTVQQVRNYRAQAEALLPTRHTELP